MCQATVFLAQADQKLEIMRDVIMLQAEGDEVRIQSFFDAPQSLHARVQEIDFLKHTVTLAPLGEKGKSA